MGGPIVVSDVGPTGGPTVDSPGGPTVGPTVDSVGGSTDGPTVDSVGPTGGPTLVPRVELWQMQAEQKSVMTGSTQQSPPS